MQAGRSRVGTPLLGLLALSWALSCADFGLGEEALRLSSETKAMSLLKKYLVSQMLYRTEGLGAEGEYGTLRDLYQAGELVDRELFGAWDGQDSVRPVAGYVFADIDADRSRRAGLCAYPAQAGSAAGRMILMLLDDRDPEEWAFYTAPFELTDRPIRRWPSASTLGSKFTRLAKRSPFGRTPF